MEKIGKLSWTTEFDTANETMTHVISRRMKMILDFKNRIISVLKDDVVLETKRIEHGYSIQDYMNYQLQVAKSAENLKAFDYDE